ncbi:MAG: hypothetical protein ACRC62_03895 [Microcoleus sp.]
MTKSITIGGQRVNVLPFSDYYFEFIRNLFDAEGNAIMDLARHSAVIEMTVEVIAPSLPKRFYRKGTDKYYWTGTTQDFGDLVNGLYVAYWQFELDAATETKNEARIHAAKSQIAIVTKAETPDIEAELAKIKNDYAVIAE